MYGTAESLNALLTYLNPRGVRERALALEVRPLRDQHARWAEGLARQHAEAAQQAQQAQQAPQAPQAQAPSEGQEVKDEEMVDADGEGGEGEGRPDGEGGEGEGRPDGEGGEGEGRPDGVQRLRAALLEFEAGWSPGTHDRWVVGWGVCLETAWEPTPLCCGALSMRPTVDPPSFQPSPPPTPHPPHPGWLQHPRL